jgi:hypothetical protein
MITSLLPAWLETRTRLRLRQHGLNPVYLVQCLFLLPSLFLCVAYSCAVVDEKRSHHWCDTGPILGIYKSLMNVDIGTGDRAIPFLGIHKWDFRCSVKIAKHTQMYSTPTAKGQWEKRSCLLSKHHTERQAYRQKHALFVILFFIFLFYWQAPCPYILLFLSVYSTGCKFRPQESQSDVLGDLCRMICLVVGSYFGMPALLLPGLEPASPWMPTMLTRVRCLSLKPYMDREVRSAANLTP